MLATAPRILKPQPGPQEAFLACDADIAGIGGAKGGGKTMALLLDPLYDISNSSFAAVVFRRTFPEIRMEGGLWDSSERVTLADGTKVPFYPSLGAVPVESRLEWSFPSGATVRFAHMEHESDRLQFLLGLQAAWLGFDQVETFTYRQFWDLIGALRSMAGVHNRIRFSCNPDPDHWTKTFMAWWLDPKTGLPIPERAGRVRWFVRVNDEIEWADAPNQLAARYGDDCSPLSFAFFPSTVYDNPILLKANPKYLATLKMMRQIQRERMLIGNWNAKEHAGSYFQRSWIPIVEQAPPLVRAIRYWDRASKTAEKATPTDSWTVGMKLGMAADGIWYICHVERFHGTPLAVEQAIDNCFTQDSRSVYVGIEQDPAQAGVGEAMGHARRIAAMGGTVLLNRVHESKGKRAEPVSALAEHGLLRMVKGPWNDSCLNEMENFDGSDKCMADQVDSLSGGYYKLSTMKVAGTWGR